MQLTSHLLSNAFPGYEVSLASRPDGRVLMVLARPGQQSSSKVIDAGALSIRAKAAKLIRQVERELKLEEGALRWHSPDDYWISLELPTYHDQPLRKLSVWSWAERRNRKHF
ncbi:DUF3509 domain-containing protein [Pseudomonas sp. JS3066]|uniref:DUF3509 domain-containing protein n=1 Tax=unclassified Pseudomonas TaxID=196821 RepID=UPI000EAA4785|nr:MULTISPECIES: DUF3509 domain-containing protein [unclassified Pseudomonas]AYF90021.1 DUF3509 domain-containing protein [Pseudomonas sp. DY-1]WVK92404.1 DUF3509 domain-containing protein [Pseudomonas sp. JS3066]